MKIIVLNCGSSSLKFQLINMDNEEILCKGNFERIGGMKTTLKLNIRGEKSEELRIARDYDEAIEYVLQVLQNPANNLISSIDEIDAIGHRVVHGGEKFDKSVFIDEEVITFRSSQSTELSSLWWDVMAWLSCAQPRQQPALVSLCWRATLELLEPTFVCWDSQLVIRGT